MITRSWNGPWMGVWAGITLIGMSVIAGCGSGDTVGGGSSGPPAALSLDANLQPLLTARCAFAGCHAGSAPQAGMDLSDGAAFNNLVNVESTSIPGRERVKPGDPAASFFFEKISQPNPTVGTQMPQGAAPLTPQEIALIEQWIRQGAHP